jgi:D-apionate oxidoisomerase
MTTIALMGAGGKMGLRLARNLGGSPYAVRHVEVSEAGRDRLRQELGLACVGEEDALSAAEVVIMAVPDAAIGKVLHGMVDKLRPGTAVIMLDAAAPHAGLLPERADLTYFVTHPCHPPLFGDEIEPEARLDFFGGERAKQNIVCALMQGPEEHYPLCEAIARIIFKPVLRAHRCTVEQIAILEPALAETVGATLCLAIRDAIDRAVAMGVPREAAVDFMLGHVNLELGIAFGTFKGGKFSDGALKAIEEAKPMIFREGWLDRVFDPKEIERSVRSICHVQ